VERRGRAIEEYSPEQFVNQERENPIAEEPRDSAALEKLNLMDPIPSAIPPQKSMESSSRLTAVEALKSMEMSPTPTAAEEQQQEEEEWRRKL
jgi:hypothetical protein